MQHDKFTLDVYEKGGLWFVRSSDCPGLLVAEHSMTAALAAVPAALHALRKARAEAGHHSAGRTSH